MTDAGSRSTRLLSLMDDIGARDMGEFKVNLTRAHRECHEIEATMFSCDDFEMQTIMDAASTLPTANRQRYLSDLAVAATVVEARNLPLLIERLRKAHLARAMAEMGNGHDCVRHAGTPADMCGLRDD